MDSNHSSENELIVHMYYNPKPYDGDRYVTVERVARFLGKTVEQVLASDLEYRVMCLGARLVEGVELYNERILENYHFLLAGEPDYSDYRY